MLAPDRFPKGRESPSSVRCLMSLPDLRKESPLGSYSNYLEYQIGRTLVWVLFDGPAQRVIALESACQQFPSIWAAVPAVISEAERASRIEPPEFWKVHEAGGTSSKDLSVRGIWIEPASGIATYEVSTNQDFDPPRQVRFSSFPDESYVMIERNKEGFISTKAR